MSANADKQYKLISKIKVSTASAHDTLHLEDVLDTSNTSQDFYAGKGYVDKERETRLKAMGLWAYTTTKSHQRQNCSRLPEGP